MSIKQKSIPKIIGLSIVAVALILLPLVIKSPYHLHLLILLGINSILALTWLLLFNTGLLSLGVAAFWCIGAYASTVLVMNFGFSFWLALPLSAIITGIVALIIGLIMVRHAGIAFVILSIIVNMVIMQLVGHIEQVGAWRGVSHIPPPDAIPIPFHAPIEFVTPTPFYYLILFLVLLTIVVFSSLYNSRTGRAWDAIRVDPRLAETLAVNLFAYRLLAFVIACSFAGLAGSFFAHYMGSIQPVAFNVFKSIYILVYAVLGGARFLIWGAIAGTAIMTYAPEWLRISEELGPVFVGIILVLLVLFLPGGLLSLPQRFPRLASMFGQMGKRIGCLLTRSAGHPKG
jgi:branched-chain amino acid transport system permease protein